MKKRILLSFGTSIERYSGNGTTGFGRCRFHDEWHDLREKAKVGLSPPAFVNVREPRVFPSEPDRTKREWRGEVGWYEWTLRELARYFFAVGILALIVFIPLQMKASWLPPDAPPIVAPALAAALALIALVASCGLAALVYRAVWGTDGWVDRTLGRRSATKREAIIDDSGRNSKD
jgi:hypothetical protein